MPHLYRVKKSGDNVVVESQHANAKQVFFGWGSDKNAVDGSFYGQEVRGAWGPNREMRYRWVLTPEAVAVMLGNLHLELTDPEYRDEKSQAAARELQRKLRAVAARRPDTRAAVPHGLCRDGRCVEHEFNSQIPRCAQSGAVKGRRR